MTLQVDARHLVASYGTVRALDFVSLTVDAGEVVAVEGPSGSGKSSLLHALAGLLELEGGSVEIAGTRVHVMEDSARARFRLENIGMVFQFGHLLGEMTCVANVALPLRLRGMSRHEAHRVALRCLEGVGLEDLEHRLPGELSGGQVQRVAVARALVTGPALVLADEPTGALDSSTGTIVLDMLIRRSREANAAVVLVTHSPDVLKHADRVISMRDGALVR